MARGTASGLLDDPKAQSVFKHSLLSEYVLPFAVMTASKIPGRRAVLVDGYAGRGRYDDGQPASGERLLIAAEKARASTDVEVMLIERAKKDFERLAAVAEEYRGRGVKATAHRGRVQDHIQAILARGSGAPLFLFLDPCGANLPFDTLSGILGQSRANPWPRTEALLNISADLTRRAAGAVNKGLHDHEAVPVMNAVCGGDWWQQTALQARDASPKDDWESAAEAVVHEYARRLGRASNMRFVVAPVRRRAHHQPVYHFVFLTRANHGLWVFGAATATARHRWLRMLGPDEETAAGMLFNLVEDQIQAESESVEQTLKNNVRALALRGTRLKLVDHTEAVLGDTYGVADDHHVRKAMRALQKDGMPMDTTPRQVRDWRIG